jgi:hypothetical protein
METVKSSPINSIVFISDNLRSKPPEHVYGALVSYNETCVSVGCYPSDDGETEFFLGRADQLAAEGEIVFDGTIVTPTGSLMISTVDGEVLLEQEVPSARTRVRVWANHLKWPDQVLVGWG